MHVFANRSAWGLLSSSLLMGAAIVAPGQKAGSPKGLDGAAIFAARCAPCHGKKGEGGAGYAKPLAGSRTAKELASFIHTAMPPAGPKPSVAESGAVAAYMYDAFYSPIAQERLRPPRVTLSRLTVKQYRNAVADLVGSFHAAIPQKLGGLRAEYFKGRNFDPKDRLIERVDPEVRFDFGTAAPAPQGFDPYNFSAAWQGSVVAPDTGEYEFVIQSDQAVRMWLNGSRRPVVDGWVRSATEKEFSGTVSLLGGRSYAVRLEFTKATPGVDDTEKRKGKPVPHAGVALLWRKPKQALEPIPARCLSPEWSPMLYVPSSPFPPDDRSIGYERGNTVSKAWEDSVTAAALDAAGYIVDNAPSVTGVPDDAKDRRERLQGFCRDFLRRAFRRPSVPDVEKAYVDRQFASTADADTALKRSILMTLMSPRFLYRELGNDKDPYVTASNLSFGLWDTVPDPELLQAAARGDLATSDGIRKQAERMANDPRTWSKLRDFLLSWLRLDEIPEIVKSAKDYPGFDPSAVADLRTSLELFLRDAAWEKDDYRELMLGNREYLNGRLAKLYGAQMPPDADFQAVPLDSGQRAGVLTQPYLLARLAYLDHSSPIHRGVLIVRSLLGRTLNPPPAAFVPLPASSHPNLTTRERVALQTKPAPCNTCHGMINPLGFTLERFDAIGRLRRAENGKPVDTSGSYLTRSGSVVKFSGATDLARFLADSEEAQSAFVEKLFQNLVKQPIRAYGADALPKLRESFQKDQYRIRSLMVQIMLATAAPKGK